MTTNLGGHTDRGRAGYQKYLAGKENITLSVKTSGSIRENVPGRVTLTGYQGSITTHVDLKTDVIFNCLWENNDKESVRYQVEYQGIRYLIHHSNLVKPGREMAVNLKPQKFGIKNIYTSTDELADDIEAGIHANSETLSGVVSDYLMSLVSLYRCQLRGDEAGKTAAEQVITQLWVSNGGRIPHLEISRDFAEMLGPLFVVHERGSKGLYNKIHEIEFPKSGSHPMIDFIIRYDRDGMIVEKKYSSKSSASRSSNTVKLTHIFKEVDEFPRSKKNSFLDSWGDHWVWGMTYQMNKYVVDEKHKMTTANGKLREWVVKSNLVNQDSSLTNIQFWAHVSKIYESDLREFFVSFSVKSIYYVVFYIDLETGIPVFVMDIDRLESALIRLKDNKSDEQIGFSIKFK